MKLSYGRMETVMKLSIIVPIYNREKTLPRCIDSLLDQDLDDYEIILVDDGSADGSGQIIRDYEAKMPGKIRGIFKENGGVASARNLGLAAAAGEYVTYVDSDDWLEKNSLGKIYREIVGGEYDILLFDEWECFNDGEKRSFPPFYDAMSGVKPGKISSREYVLARPCPWNQWTKRDVWVKGFGDDLSTAFPDGKLYEDLGTLPRLAIGAKKIGYLAEPFYCYYQSEGSIMRTTDYRSGYDDIFSIAEILKKTLGDKYKAETEYLWWEHLLISGGRRYLDCGRDDLAVKVADAMKAAYPDWKSNPYVMRESKSKKLLAELIYGKKFRTVRTLQKVKRMIK